MKKSLPMLLSIFSGLILIALIVTIVAVVMVSNMYELVYDPYYGTYVEQFSSAKANTAIAFSYVGLVTELTSIIGTFVTSIVMLVKSKQLDSSIKGFFKGVSITAIVISSVGLLFSFLGTFVVTALAFVCIVGMIVVFGLSIAANVKYKKVTI